MGEEEGGEVAELEGEGGGLGGGKGTVRGSREQCSWSMSILKPRARYFLRVRGVYLSHGVDI